MITLRFSITFLVVVVGVLHAQTDSELKEVKAQREQQKEMLEASEKPQALTEADLSKIEQQAISIFDREAGSFALDVSQRLDIASRMDDPFGLSVNGDLVGKRVQPSNELAAGETAEKAEVKPTYVNAVNALKVNGMNLTTGEFIVGHRVVRAGDTLTLGYAGLSFVVKVVDIKRNVIVFEDHSGGGQATDPPARTALNLAIIPPDRPAQFSPLPQ